MNVPRPSQNSNDSHTFPQARSLMIPGFPTPQTILFLYPLSPKDPKPIVPQKGADLGVVLPSSHLTALACVNVRRNELGSATIVIVKSTSSLSFLPSAPLPTSHSHLLAPRAQQCHCHSPLVCACAHTHTHTHTQDCVLCSGNHL